MLKWLAKRVGFSIITIIITIMISWALIEYSPESPANFINSVLPPNSIAGKPTLRLELEQYLMTLKPHGNPLIDSLQYLWQVLHGNLGIDIISQVPVTTIIAQALPWTVFIVTTSILISYFLGIRLGMKIGYKRGTKVDSSLMSLFTVTRSIPVYISGALLLFFLGFELGWFPTGGAFSINVTPGFNIPFILSVIKHAFLPILTLTLANLAGWVLHMRANTIYTLGEDYVSFAEIRGINSNNIETKYVGRNAILPLYTSLIYTIGFSFGGSIFVEEIFSYPGVGHLLYNAIQYNDYPLEMGIFIILIASVVVGILLADLTYSLLDPRVKVGE
ncbi:ABC transporter permease [Candidatus Acidianus copahuensis]|uniref:ABC transporter permease n=1 Tax=Candidatus Acidianus copahuensis TaxID=1160895 RepID=A0A031LSC7_9CREN|nr:ABC transporter permease [Candidatus Acidianus copahuensis]EZQ10043.1 ABC transporter permease [Candidatus Acidianus copahuensis]